MPPGFTTPQRQLVHVEVLLERGDHLLAVARQLGRVEHHHVELLAVVRRIAQPGEEVGLHEARAHVVQVRVLLGDLDDVVVEVDADDFRRAAHRRVDRETAGVAAQVEHALAGAQVREPFAVVALVGEEAGLVRARGATRKRMPCSVMIAGAAGSRAAAVERLLLLHVLLGEPVEAAAGEMRAQRLVDPLAVAEHAGAKNSTTSRSPKRSTTRPLRPSPSECTTR